MKLDTKTTLRRRVIYGGILLVTLYALLSAAIAWNTVDKCGSNDSPKNWSFYPPEWVCERGSLRT